MQDIPFGQQRILPASILVVNLSENYCLVPIWVLHVLLTLFPFTPRILGGWKSSLSVCHEITRIFVYDASLHCLPRDISPFVTYLSQMRFLVKSLLFTPEVPAENATYGLQIRMRFLTQFCNLMLQLGLWQECPNILFSKLCLWCLLQENSVSWC